MKGKAPSVFVSSTCYDLKQIRADLKEFIESFNFNAVLSEYNSFPINPDLDTVQNCLESVKENADIFVLIIGGRYGYITEKGKSITNLEYLQAKAKKIPIYVFIDKTIINVLPIWKANPDSNFKDVADSPKLFEFVSSIRETSGIWTHPFENVAEITTTLKIQWSYLFTDSLKLRRQIKNSHLSENLSKLTGESLRLVIERPPYWEYLLFGEVIENEHFKLSSLENDIAYEVFVGKPNILEGLEAFSWTHRKLPEITRLIESIQKIFDLALQDAVGEPGQAGDADKIVYVAKKFVEVYKRILEWVIEFHETEVDPEFEKLVNLTSRLTENIIQEIKQFILNFQKNVKEALNSAPEDDKEQRTVNLTLKITVPELPELYEEFDRIRQIFE
jgi:hypothetical protein